MSTKIDVETFITVVRKSGLIDRDRLDLVISEFQASGVPVDDALPLVDRLIAAKLLTPWQSEKLLQKKHRGYFLGKYKLLSLLGKGGMSSVFLAEHLLLRRRCALKVLPGKRVDDSSYLERFHREAQAVAALDHPNIVRAYDVDHQNEGDQQIHFLVMEHVDGQNLHEIVAEKGVLNFLDAAEYARQAAAGLKHAHEQGMIHRDIKPGNLLVDLTGVVKILDLGLARFFTVDEGNDALTIRNDEKVLGTADYLSPEQALDSHTVDVRADIYSLGCTLYFMLTGQPPFTDGTLAQRLMAHQVKTPPSIESRRTDVPLALASIVRKMMEKRPNDRYLTADETENALFNWIDANADDVWRKQHSNTYGSRSSALEIVPKAIPVAQPIASPKHFENLVDPTKKLVATPVATETFASGNSTITQDDTSPIGSLTKIALENPGSTSEQLEAIRPSAASTIHPNQQVTPESIQTENRIPGNDQSPTTIPDFPSIEFPDIAANKSDALPIFKKKSPHTLLDAIRYLSITHRALLVMVGVFVSFVVIYSTGPFGGLLGTKYEKKPLLVPFPKDKRDVVVGGPNAEFSSIHAALAVVRERYRPRSGNNDRFFIRVMPGVYSDLIRVDGQSKNWPEGITILGDGDVRLQATGNEPVIHLANISRFTIENIQIVANNREIGIDLSGNLHETRLSNLVVRGFVNVGIRCKGAQGLSFGKNQLVLEGLKFESSGENAYGIQLEEGPDSDSNNIQIRDCRFLGPMSSGIRILGREPYGIEISESIFNHVADGIRFEGQPILKGIQVLNNTFRQSSTGIRFSNLPAYTSSGFSFRRNLFVETNLAEMIIEKGFVETEFRTMLSANPVGIENNWSDRDKPMKTVEGEVTLLFESGRQGVKDCAFVSKKPNDRGFLYPSDKSPIRDVPGTQVNDKKWVGAIGQ